MYRYSIVKRKWYSITYKDKAPLARYGHALLYWNGSLYLMGGYDQHGFCCDDLYQFTPDTHTWRKIQWISPLGSVTIGRFHSAACIYKSKILVYAGKGIDAARRDLLEYDLSNHTWKQIVPAKSSDQPSGRWGHSANVIGDFLYVFGGRDAILQFNELYCFDLINLKWKALLPSQKGATLAANVPEPRYFHSSVAVGNSIFFIWGKNIYDFNFDDIIEWRINGGTNELSASASVGTSKDRDEIRSSVKSQGSDSSISFATLGSNGMPPISSGSRLSGEKRMRLKCLFRDEMRIISVSPVIGYSELTDRLNSEYGEDDLKIQYEDDEGDLITIRSAADVEEAFVFFGDAHRPSVKLLLSSQSSSNSLNNFGMMPASPSTGTPIAISQRPNRLSREVNGTSPIPISNSPNLSQTSGPTPLLPRRSSRPDMKPSTSPGSPRSTPKRLSAGPKQIVKWQSGGIIGEGGFGKVYLGMNSETGELMAVKQVPLGAESNQQIESLRREIALIQDLHHPNIVRYFGSEAKDGFLNIFLEYQPGGSIASLLTKFQHLGEKVIRSFTKQTLMGLDYLHGHGIAHRDIKGANLLVDLSGCVKLADFGASKQLADLRSFSEGCKTVTGSPYWMAPEVIQGNAGGRSYGRKADIWSLGAVVVEMVTGKPPFHNLAPVTALFRIGSSSAVPDIPSALSPHGRDFLSLCFRRDVSTRPTAAELLSHPWITELDESASPTISTTFDTKTLAFQHENERSHHVHVIEAPQPVPMPKNPKASSSTSSATLNRTESAASADEPTKSSADPSPSHKTVATTSDPDSGKIRSRKKSPRSSRPKSSSKPSSPRTDSDSSSKSKTRRKSPVASPTPQVDSSDVDDDGNDEEDGFGSILNFVSTRAPLT